MHRGVECHNTARAEGTLQESALPAMWVPGWNSGRQVGSLCIAESCHHGPWLSFNWNIFLIFAIPWCMFTRSGRTQQRCVCAVLCDHRLSAAFHHLGRTSVPFKRPLPSPSSRYPWQPLFCSLSISRIYLLCMFHAKDSHSMCSFVIPLM